jgi:hypothetical protein
LQAPEEEGSGMEKEKRRKDRFQVKKAQERKIW